MKLAENLSYVSKFLKMGHFTPIFLAFVLNSLDLYIFTSPKGYSCLPFLSYFLFLLAVFFLLWDIKLRPANFRKLFRWADFTIEFVINMMLMEIIMFNFWFPLEMAFLQFLSNIPHFMEQFMTSLGFHCTGLCKICDFLKWEGSLYLASNVLSAFFLICILHATRVADFRILRRRGGGAFLDDATSRGRKFCGKVVSTVNTECHRKPRIARNYTNCSKLAADSITACYDEDYD